MYKSLIQAWIPGSRVNYGVYSCRGLQRNKRPLSECYHPTQQLDKDIKYTESLGLFIANSPGRDECWTGGRLCVSSAGYLAGR
jgi:hypothetical protein